MRSLIRPWAAALALAIGVASLFCDHFQFSPAITFQMHALFGLVATATITAVLLEKARSCPTQDLCLYTRLVSRWSCRFHDRVRLTVDTGELEWKSATSWIGLRTISAPAPGRASSARSSLATRTFPRISS